MKKTKIIVLALAVLLTFSSQALAGSGSALINGYEIFKSTTGSAPNYNKCVQFSFSNVSPYALTVSVNLLDHNGVTVSASSEWAASGLYDPVNANFSTSSDPISGESNCTLDPSGNFTIPAHGMCLFKHYSPSYDSYIYGRHGTISWTAAETVSKALVVTGNIEFKNNSTSEITYAAHPVNEGKPF